MRFSCSLTLCHHQLFDPATCVKQLTLHACARIQKNKYNQTKQRMNNKGRMTAGLRPHQSLFNPEEPFKQYLGRHILYRGYLCSRVCIQVRVHACVCMWAGFMI